MVQAMMMATTIVIVFKLGLQQLLGGRARRGYVVHRLFMSGHKYDQSGEFLGECPDDLPDVHLSVNRPPSLQDHLRH